MKKFKGKKIYILIILVLVLVIFLLAYNSFINLSYIRRKYDKYTFMLPKEIKYVEEQDHGIIKHDKIIDSSIEIYSETYDSTKEILQKYTFYNGSVEVVSEDEIDKDKLYVVTKKIKYYDNNKTVYMLSYLYRISDNQQFVISIECKNLKDINYFIKKLKRTAKSIILY